MKKLGCLVVTGYVLGVVACGPTDEAGSLQGGDTRDTGVSVDRDSAPGIDSDSPDTAPTGCEDSGGDALDDDGIDSNCDGADGVVGKDVYVDGVVGADTNPGTPTKPKRTIDAALKAAVVQEGAVVVAAGSYAIDAIERAGSWRVAGGYGAGFVGKPKRELTRLEPSTSTGLLVSAAAKGTLTHLTIVGAAPAATDGAPTAHALRSSAELLVLDDVVVRAADGRAGTNGKDGTQGTGGVAGYDGFTAMIVPKLTCNGVLQPTYSFGSEVGAPNAEGKPPGNFTAKSGASVGRDGVDGSDGADAAKTPLLSDGMVVWGRASTGLSNGLPGYGGAGGSASGCYNWELRRNAGGGATGGCPGGGGEGGVSGGGSVAILVLAGEVHVGRSLIATGSGGDGGAGGAGGAGGGGGAGGRPSTDAGSCPPTDTSGCACWGGGGGDGGRGGRGGGGAGGWTLGVINVGGAIAKIDGATVFELGRPGAGGPGNAGGYASSGEKRTTFSM